MGRVWFSVIMFSLRDVTVSVTPGTSLNVTIQKDKKRT